MKVRRNELEIGTFSFKLSEFRRVLVIGGGKATAGMALEIEQILDGWITGGSVNIPAYTKPWPKGKQIKFNPASHPVPSKDGVRGVKNMLRLGGHPSEDDLVICLISGGGSALMPLPSTGLQLSDKQKTTNLLLRSGAKIDEINAVRKHLSDFKGGRLAEKLHPATVLSLVISDVVGDKLESIASGPTVPDDTTYADAYKILQERGLWRTVPGSVRKRIQKGKEGKLPETPKKGSKGRGGRNQELVLSAASSIRGNPAILISSIGTDGIDGPTNAAGAVADGKTVERGLRVHMDPESYLRENNSYPFFERLNDLVITGPTGTNVNDIFIGVVGPGNQKNDTARRSRGK